MAIDFFNARWSRIFSDAGLKMTGTDKLFFPQVTRENTFTKNVVGFQRTDPNHRGTRLVQEDNLALKSLFAKIDDIHVYVYVPKDTREIAQALIDRYGVPLHADWFVLGSVTDEQVHNMPFDIELRLNAMPWCFSDPNDFITVTVHEPNVDLATAFASNIIDAPKLPYKIQQGKTNIELVSVGTDFTPLYEEDYTRLLEITTSEDLFSAAAPAVYRADTLVRLIEERTGIPTTRQSTSDTGVISTEGAVLVYHGKPSGYPTANTDYDRVLVFTIACPSYVGDFYFHYNALY